MHPPRRTRGVLLAALSLLLLGLGLNVASAASTPAPGWAVSQFATGFPDGGSIGPIGVTFDAAGNLFVANAEGDRILYKFGPAGGVANPSTAVGLSPAFGLTTGKDGMLYATGPGVIEVNPATGAEVRQVSTQGGLGIATDPKSGDLFVASGCNILRVSGYTTATPTTSTYVTVPTCTGDLDGLSFGPDGTLYAANIDFSNVTLDTVVSISGTTTSPVTVSTVATVPNVDGTAVASDNSFLVGNRNDGIITKVDLTSAAHTQTNIVTGGSRATSSPLAPMVVCTPRSRPASRK
jgi:hypothetical protein